MGRGTSPKRMCVGLFLELVAAAFEFSQYGHPARTGRERGGGKGGGKGGGEGGGG